MTIFYLHTNLPAPYRKHQFEAISSEFPGSKVFFYDQMHSDRNWSDDISDWKVPCHRFSRFISLPKVGRISLGAIWQILKQPKGVIHLVGDCSGSFYLILLLGRIKGGKLIFWNDGGFAESISKKFQRFFTKKIRPLFDATFTPGKIGHSYSTALGFDRTKIYNAYFSHDISFFQQKGVDRKRSQVLGHLIQPRISDDSFVILTISRFLDWKRLEDLSDALIQIDNLVKSDVHMILIGNGAHDGPLIKMKNNLRNIHLHHIPAIAYQDIPGWYSCADLFVLPSEGDIWGLVVNEALSMGVPVICTSAIGSAELVHNGINGYTVPPRSPVEIANKIWHLYSNKNILFEMKNKSKGIKTQWNTEMAINELHRLAANIK